MKKIKISFSREVAETLGLESAVILELFNQNLLDNSSYDDLVLSINENANYLDDGKIESSIDKLLRYDFIKIKNTSNGANFSVKTASKNNNSKLCFSQKSVLVFGSEGKGVRELVKKECDEIIQINMKNNLKFEIDSLNVSNATSIALYQFYSA